MKDFWKWESDLDEVTRQKAASIGLRFDPQEALTLERLTPEQVVERIDDHWNDLSPREKELILQIAKGLS